MAHKHKISIKQSPFMCLTRCMCGVCACVYSSVLRCSLYNVVVVACGECVSVVQFTINDKSKSNESTHEIKSVLTMTEVTNRMFLIYTISNIMFFFISYVGSISYLLLNPILLHSRNGFWTETEISDIKRYSNWAYSPIAIHNHKINVFYMRLFAAKSTIHT